MVLSTLAGVGVAWGLLAHAVPRYTSTSRIYVERALPQVLDADMSVVHSSNYLNTQAEIIGSSSVLGNVLARPEIKALSSIPAGESGFELLREQLRVAVGQHDDIINISVELENKDDAALVVNAIVDAYIAQYIEDKKTDFAQVLKILSEEKIRRDDELKHICQRIEAFRKEHSSLAVQVNDNNVVAQRFGRLAEELNATQVQLLEAKARYDKVRQMYDSPVQRPFLLDLATANSLHLRDANLEDQVRQTEQSLTEQLSRWGEGYPAVKLLQARLDDLRNRLQRQRDSIIEGYVESLSQEHQLLEHKRNELQRAYDEQFALASDVSSQGATLAALQVEQARAETACDLIDDRIRQINLTGEAVGTTNVSIMEYATAGIPTYPVHAKFLGIGCAFGAMLGIALAWLRDLFDQRLRSIDEITEVTQLPVLGTIPMLTGEKSRLAAGKLLADDPHSPAAEAIRTLRTGTHFSLGGDEARLLLVTSPSSGDGKSTVASNLAIAMSQVHGRVLLVDADLRRPRQAEIFHVDANVGLANTLTDRTPVETAIHHRVLGTLDLLPCGKAPANPVELLNSSHFAEVLQQLLTQYDKIIIDSPPVIPVADARIISAVADSTLLVLRAELSTRRLAVAARDELRRVRAKRIGIVVNAVPARHPAYGYGGGYGYGSHNGYVDQAYGDKEDSLELGAAAQGVPDRMPETLSR